MNAPGLQTSFNRAIAWFALAPLVVLSATARPLKVDLGSNTGRSDTAAPRFIEWQFNLHHNLPAHCAGRNWSLAGGLNHANRHAGWLDIRNNVAFNWRLPDNN
jgi:hypothetical protein